MAEELKAKTLEIATQLVAFESITSHSNLDIACYIESLLSDAGLDYRRIYDSTGQKTSLLASIGPTDRPGVVLSGHMDVVPVAGQAWSSPPFSATLREGRVFGRGTTDMKGFLAVVLAHLPSFAAAARATPIHLAFSYDEEVGCRGVPDLAAAVAGLPARPALCIVGEPTGLRAVNAHKGKVAFRVEIIGRGGHSALPQQGANAAVAAARVAVALDDLARELEAAPDPGSPFVPPWTTVHVGSVHGGGALNLVPDAAALEFEIRYLPGVDPAPLLDRIRTHVEDVGRRLRATAPEAKVSLTEIAAYPALATPADHPALRTTARLAGDAGPATAVSFGTEGGVFAAAGIPTVVCGPGDMGRAHKADEWIGLDELAAASAMMERLAARLHRPIEDWIGS